MSDPTIQRLTKFSHEDIRSIIGPSKAACDKNEKLRNLPSLRKEVIAKAWSSYNTYKAAEKLEEEDPKTPYVQIESDEEGVYAKITCDSEKMLKFVQMHLDNYQNSFKKPKQKRVYSLYATLSHISIPKLIGRKGSVISSVKEESISQMDETFSEKEIQDCEKSYLKIDKFTPRDFEDFKAMVVGSNRSAFVGWDPEEEEELVKIFVSSFAEEKVFEEFVECLSGILNEKISEIKEEDSKFLENKEKELQDCYEALDTSFD